MYTISEIVELGDARELILSEIKVVSRLDDSQDNTLEPSEYFEE